MDLYVQVVFYPLGNILFALTGMITFNLIPQQFANFFLVKDILTKVTTIDILVKHNFEPQ